MYWIRSCYSLNSINCISLLQKLFGSAHGSIHLNGLDNPDNYKNQKRAINFDEYRREPSKYEEQIVEIVEWQKDPFNRLFKIFNTQGKLRMKLPHKIYSRISGPQSILGTCFNTRNVAGFQKRNIIITPIIQTFADRIDQMVSFEMSRTNDLAVIYRPLEEKLTNIEQLILAARISKYGTHFLPDELNQCLYILNEQSVYIIAIRYDGTIDNNATLMFDKDEGFVSPFLPKDSNKYKFLNDKFLEWKKNNYEKEFPAYFPNYFDKLHTK
jgi:hypothetical protein